MTAQPVTDHAVVPDLELPGGPSPVTRRVGLAMNGVRDIVASAGGRLRDFVLTELFLRRSPY
jgi:hypothetical protein